MEELPNSTKDENHNQGVKKNPKQPLYWKVSRVAAVFGIIELVSLVLWIKAEDFPDKAFYLRWIASCGIAAGAFYLIHKLITGKKRKRKLRINWTVWGLVCLVLLFTKSQPLKLSHLRLQLNRHSDIFVQLQMELTNEFLMFRSNSLVATNAHGLLMIPVPFATSNVVLSLGVRNDSLSETEDSVSIVMYLIRGIPFSLNPGWVPCGQDKAWEVFCHRFPFPFLPTDAQTVPDITFPLPEILKKAWPMRIELISKSSPRSTIAFWLRYEIADPAITNAKLFYFENVSITKSNTIKFAPK